MHLGPRDRVTLPTSQKAGFETHYQRISAYTDHGRSSNPVTRFLIDRRLRIAMRRLIDITAAKPADWTALVVCAGDGVEGTFLANAGFKEVTISDFSEIGLEMGASLDNRLKTRLLDAGNMDVPDDSYDLVLVQDGLHHLPCPPAGLTEMIRVAKRAVIVIEPHSGIVSRILGTEWERTDCAINYVFRWNRWLFESVVRSYLLMGSKTAEVAERNSRRSKKLYSVDCDPKRDCSYSAEVIRLWDHHNAMGRGARMLGNGTLALAAVRAAYAFCTIVFPRLGNMFIGIVVKSIS